MQLWDDVLYPSFRATIRGEYYGIISEDAIDEECFHLAQRAVATFKFPKISTKYTVFHAIRQEDHSLLEVDQNNPNGIPHARFNEDLGFEELSIIIAWMKVYWCENQISNADNFDDIYTDPNIKVFSRANSVEKTRKLMADFRSVASDLEKDYGRVTTEQKPSVGDING